jgi:hypothetical protein
MAVQTVNMQVLLGQSCDITLFAVSTNPQVLPDFITTTNVQSFPGGKT